MCIDVRIPQLNKVYLLNVVWKDDAHFGAFHVENSHIYVECLHNQSSTYACKVGVKHHCVIRHSKMGSDDPVDFALLRSMQQLVHGLCLAMMTVPLVWQT